MPENGESYSIQDVQARQVVDVTEGEGDVLVGRGTPLAVAVDDAAAAAGPGSPVAAALGELRAVHDGLIAELRSRLDSAIAGTRVAINAYVTADSDMAGQYVPLPR